MDLVIIYYYSSSNLKSVNFSNNGDNIAKLKIRFIKSHNSECCLFHKIGHADEFHPIVSKQETPLENVLMTIDCALLF